MADSIHLEKDTKGSSALANYTICGSDGWTEWDDFYNPQRGYRSHVSVDDSGGVRYQVIFITPWRFAHELRCRQESGGGHRGEINSIFIPVVGLQEIREAVEYLWIGGFFRGCLPLSDTAPNWPAV